MKQSHLCGIVLIIIIAGVILYTGVTDQNGTVGEYAYACDSGVEFSMTPAADMSTIKIMPGDNAEFETSTLMKVEVGAGERYEGNGIEFVGAGEEVQLIVDDNLHICNPVPSADAAPFNWGDAGEGGIKQDVAVIVSDSIVGKWQSTEDERFVREFKDNGTVSDWYDNEVRSEGTWDAFTSDDDVSVSFPLQDDTVYIQLMMSGTQAETLNFRLSKLTPEELNLTYMDRGGELMFRAIQ